MVVGGGGVESVEGSLRGHFSFRREEISCLSQDHVGQHSQRAIKGFDHNWCSSMFGFEQQCQKRTERFMKNESDETNRRTLCSSLITYQ